MPAWTVIAASSGLSRPVWNAALRKAQDRTASDAAPCGSVAPSSPTTPSVSVPVLSVQRMSMLPKFSMELILRTITPCRAILWAPCESVMLTMAGSSSGVRPTARASEKRSESIAGFPSRKLKESTITTITSITWVSRLPKRWMPRSNSVSDGRMPRRWAIPPSTVSRPVTTTSRRAVPLLTLVPMNAQLDLSARLETAGAAPGAFSTGKVSPVSVAWLTYRSSDSRRIPSAGTRLPADSWRTSPGTISTEGIASSLPPR